MNTNPYEKELLAYISIHLVVVETAIVNIRDGRTKTIPRDQAWFKTRKLKSLAVCILTAGITWYFNSSILDNILGLNSINKCSKIFSSSLQFITVAIQMMKDYEIKYCLKYKALGVRLYKILISKLLVHFNW